MLALELDIGCDWELIDGGGLFVFGGLGGK